MKALDEPVYVTRSFLPPYEEYCARLKHIWDSHWLTNNGELHNALQKKLEEYLAVRHVTLFVNGHSALDVAVKALGLKGEVITTPFTFVSTTHALVMNGLKPVFCDIKSTDYTIDEEKIEALITPQTTAIVAVHVYGYPCNVQRIEEIARKHGLKVIYDAAHAFGVSIGERSIGSYGDVSMLSFHATKVFHTIEGGALLYADDSYIREFDLYKNFGITGPETVEAVGLNAKMNEFCAVMGLTNLEYVDEQIRERKAVVERYRQGLQDVPGILFSALRPDVDYNYAYVPIVVDEQKYGHTRDELFDYMAKYNIFARKYFYPIMTECDCYREEYGQTELPVAKYVSDRVLTLPIYGEIDAAVVDAVIQLIHELHDLS
jgi:dTDP-4-amino-4,6-dideoxygalactose transaminase